MFLDILKIKKQIPVFAAAFFAFAAIGSVLWYILCPSAAFFHSDCSDTIFWAQASYDGKTLFNPEFGYAAILPFGGTLIMWPLVALFGVSMTTHRLGMVIFSLIFFGGIYLLSKALKFSQSLSLTTVGLTALILCSSEKMREIFYEHVIYYSISVAIICVLLALYVHFTENFSSYGKKRMIPVCLLIYAFTFMSALDGTQVISCAVLPVVFAAGCEVLFSKEKLFSKSNIPAYSFCGLVMFASIIGLAALKVQTANLGVGYAEAYSNYSDMGEWLNNFLKLPTQWFELFGVDAAYGMNIFSPESIINLIRIAAALILGIAPVAALIFIGRLDRPSKLLVYTHFGMTAVIMFGYIFGLLSAANWRLSPIICTAILVCVAGIRAMNPHIVLKRVSAGIMCVMILLCAVNLKTVTDMPANGVENNHYYPVIQYLKSQGLEYGFSTFWHSQTITVLSDSEVRIANTDINENGVTPCAFQTNKKWFEEQEGVDRYFLLCTLNELATLMQTDDWHYFIDGPIEQLEFDGYVIFVFDNLSFLE
ncbi:MAG: hypothetical protein IKB88_10545 [Clostridia bacterium]|nr:hypothetical protein [Clostridia bacterium]